MFSSKEELIKFMKERNAYYFKDLIKETGLEFNQLRTIINRKLKLHLYDLKKEIVFEYFEEGYSVKQVHLITTIPEQTLYNLKQKYNEYFYRTRRKKLRAEYSRMLKQCNFSLNCIYKKYGISYDKIKSVLKKIDLYDWYLKFKIHKPKRHKRGELQKKAFEYFDKYPVALTKSGKYLAKLFDCTPRDANRLKKKYKEKQKEKE